MHTQGRDMKRGIGGLWAATAVFALTGCATSTVAPHQAKLVPADRVYHQPALSADATARAVFVRDAGVFGSGVYLHLIVDGKKAASLDPGEKVELLLAPGEHIFGIVPTDLFGMSAVRSIDQHLRAGERYYYRILTDMNAGSAIQRYLPVAP